jgi:hypothetical protein
MNEIEKLKARLVELHEISVGIQAKADAEKRDLKAEEQTELDSVMLEFDTVEADIKRRERIQAQESRLAQPAGRISTPNPVASADPVRSAPRDGLQNTMEFGQGHRAVNKKTPPNRGFRTFEADL